MRLLRLMTALAALWMPSLSASGIITLPPAPGSSGWLNLPAATDPGGFAYQVILLPPVDQPGVPVTFVGWVIEPPLSQPQPDLAQFMLPFLLPTAPEQPATLTPFTPTQTFTSFAAPATHVFIAPAGGLSPGQSVPEPASLILLAAGAALVFLARRAR